MRKIILILPVLAVLFCCESCGGRKKKDAGTDKTADTAAQTQAPKEFRAVDVPVSISDESGRLEWFAEHFWDNVDFSDNAWVDNPNIEQAFADYLMILNNLPDMPAVKNTVSGMMRKLGGKATPEMYYFITGLYEKYLYDPNSPYRNEEVYITVLERIVENPRLEDIEKVRPRSQLEMAMKNRVGEKANDFPYRTAQGKAGSMYGIRADYLLVFFYNLGCQACKEVRAGILELFGEPMLAGMLDSGRLKVLAVYADKDMTEWDKYVEDIPSDWINVYDPAQAINEGELYDMRAIPSLYLLDRDKRVILKDFVDPSLLYYAIYDAENRR